MTPVCLSPDEQHWSPDRASSGRLDSRAQSSWWDTSSTVSFDWPRRRSRSLVCSFELDVCKDMYNLDTAARYSKYKTQLKYNIIQWSYLKHVSYHIQQIKVTNQLVFCLEYRAKTLCLRQDTCLEFFYIQPPRHTLRHNLKHSLYMP
jgi:hypothetical protein